MTWLLVLSECKGIAIPHIILGVFICAVSCCYNNQAPRVNLVQTS